MGMLLAEDIMTRQVFSLRASDDLAVASDLMDSLQVRHLPVVNDEGDVIGIVSHRDLIEAGMETKSDLPISAVREILKETRVEEIMVRDVTTVAPTDELKEIGQEMLEFKFGCMPVTEGKHLVGLITEADFIRFVTDHSDEFAEVLHELGEGGYDADRNVLKGKWPNRDNLTGRSAGGMESEESGGGFGGPSMGETQGTETGEELRATAPGGWQGTDDDNSSAESDKE